MLRSRLKSWLTWQPQPPELLALMRPVKPWPVQIDRYSLGIDNTRIDVRLSPLFVTRARALVRTMVRHDVATHYWGKSESQPRPQELEAFRESYRALVEGAMPHRQQLAAADALRRQDPDTDQCESRRRQLDAADRMRLVELSLLKFLLQSVPGEIQHLRRQLEIARDGEQASERGQRLKYHEQLVTLAREERAVAYRVYRRLFRLVDKLETVHLRKLRKSFLGTSWPLPREILFNALLQLPNLLAEEEVMHHYPILYIEEQGRTYLRALNLCLVEVFKEYLPTWCQPGTRREGDEAAGRSAGLRLMDRRDQGGLVGFLETEILVSQLLREEEYRKPRNTWLDDPDNLSQLLDDQRLLPGSARSGSPRDERLGHQWRHFRRALQEELFRRLERLDILPQVVASYWTPRIHQELAGAVSARMIYEYLTGRQSKRKVLRRLTGSQAEVAPALVIKTLEFAAGEIKHLPRDSLREYALRILVDFLVLRRDLKLAYKTFEALDQIRLLSDEDDTTLSRTNGLLYEFSLPQERSDQQPIHNHVILKADVRGSSRIIAELLAKKLNPATHFSRNFFNPINEYLEDFGANKVFVEGDAVILSFLGYPGVGRRWLSVAHACGMATRILEVVNRQNLLNRRHGLPQLELGLGIAFCDEEPTFLYDGDRQIMISPAINLADRLSSCAKALRDSELFRGGRPFRVEVLVPQEGSDALAGAKTDVLRYNLNGIEMDDAAFAELTTELVLHRMDIEVAGQPQRFHIGRYPDRSGRMHWLVVREAPVRVWDSGRVREQRHPDGRRFYEVVVDPALRTLIRSKLRPVQGEGTVPPRRALAEDGSPAGSASQRRGPQGTSRT
jgi:hypothetical protein